jgi:hypothetical protein
MSNVRIALDHTWIRPTLARELAAPATRACARGVVGYSYFAWK